MFYNVDVRTGKGTISLNKPVNIASDVVCDGIIESPRQSIVRDRQRNLSIYCNTIIVVGPYPSYKASIQDVPTYICIIIIVDILY